MLMIGTVTEVGPGRDHSILYCILVDKKNVSQWYASQSTCATILDRFAAVTLSQCYLTPVVVLLIFETNTILGRSYRASMIGIPSQSVVSPQAPKVHTLQNTILDRRPTTETKRKR